MDFDEIFSIPNRALFFNRVHPYIKKDWKWAIQSFLLQGFFTLIFFLVVYNIIWIDIKGKNFSQTCKDGTMSIIFVVVTIQYSVLICYRHSLLKIINFVKHDYASMQNLTPEERNIVEKYAKWGNYVTKQWIVITSLCGISFLAKSVCLMLYYYYIGEFKLVPYYENVFPPIIERNRHKIYVYLFIYACQMQYAAYACVMYGGFVPIAPFLMLHASGQMEIVKLRIDKLFSEPDDKIVTAKLKEIIIRLQSIYSFVDLIVDIFKVCYEFTLKLMSVMLPITVYEVKVTLRQGTFSLEFISFIVGATLFSSTPCYYSQLIMDKGEEVRQAIYACGWEHHHNIRTRNTLRMMLVYALRPVAIQTIFRTLCLDGMTDLFQQSYTIFNLMNAMFE